jgi:phage-related minor tail protein
MSESQRALKKSKAEQLHQQKFEEYRSWLAEANKKVFRELKEKIENESGQQPDFFQKYIFKLFQ